MALGALPNELLLLLFSLLRQKDVCRLSQASRIWHQRVEEHLPERQHAWRHGVALLSWAERAVKRVRHRRQQSRQRVSMVMHSFAPVHAPAQLLQMASSRVHSSVSSLCAAFTSAAASFLTLHLAIAAVQWLLLEAQMISGSTCRRCTV